MKTLLLQNWKFSLNADENSWYPETCDSKWQDVVVPHDWAVTLPFSKNNSSGTGYVYGGTGWYRTVFTVPSGWKGKDAAIHFDGVYKNSQVWCNGSYLGKRPSGYSNFKYSIGHCLREGENIIAVKVTHEDIADSRWYTGSGIYRKVYINFYDSVYIDETSLFVTNDFSDNEAEMKISGKVMGCFNALNNLQIFANLICSENKTVSNTRELGLETGDWNKSDNKEIPFEMTLKVPDPKLWSVNQPNLYTLNLEIRSEDKTLSATPPLRTGFRSIKFDPDKGFFLNGKSMKIKGVCVHHDAGCLGAAVWQDVWQRRLEKLKEAGCNAIRMSHNPHMIELYDLCDEMGFLVIDEAFDEWEGCKNKWWQGHNVYPPKHQGYSYDFPHWHEEDLKAMVLRGRNHPCIIAWSIGNEIDYPNDPYVHPLFLEMTGNNDANKPAAERQYNKNKPNMERLTTIAANLVKIVKKHDTTRPVTVAAAFPELSSYIGFLDAVDIAGFNYKENLYKEDHQRFPKLPILGTENGHSISAWKAVTENNFISGQFLWTGVDFLGEAEGWPIRCSGAGILDTAGFEKTAWYRRRALWCETPVLHLASCVHQTEEREIIPEELFRCWDYSPGENIDVICYTNMNEAELFLNGKSMGIGKCNKDYSYILWTIPFEQGEIIVKANDICDNLKSAQKPVSLRLTEWKPKGNCKIKNAQGKYRIAQIKAELLDENNLLCTKADSSAGASAEAGAEAALHINLSGPAQFLGMENGKITDCTEYRSYCRSLYNGRIIIYLLIDTSSNEPCTLTGAIDGIKPAKITGF